MIDLAKFKGCMLPEDWEGYLLSHIGPMPVTMKEADYQLIYAAPDLLAEVERLQGVVAEERLRWQKNEAEVESLRERLIKIKFHVSGYTEGAIATYALKRIATELEGTMNNCQCQECEKIAHKSDCAVHNAPANPKRRCDCGAELGGE